MMVTSLLAFVLVIAICVLSHEAGHFFIARRCGVKVHEFSFGMGPSLASFKRKDTLWSLRAVPVGGFVRLAGMGEEQTDEVIPPGGSFQEKSAWKRLAILAGGSASNIFLAVLITAILLWGHGVLDLSSTRIGEIMAGYPADKAGLVAGDRIEAVSGSIVSDWTELSSAIRERSVEGPVLILFERDGEIKEIFLEIPFDPINQTYLLGIRPSIKKYPLGRAFTGSIGYIWNFSLDIVRGILQWVTGRGQVDVTGPVGIASMAGQAAREGLWTFLAFLSMINLHLGILNLLPFPALDGGRILIIGGEIVTGRKLPEKWENLVHLAGFALLILLLLFVTWKDLIRLF
ncbi:MAG TPA: M50 family metallopeptidase [Synergistales bacterium]|jgi:regulator of sigma E protease|nr:M50 family metallopeptidase [Synergistales bacterium]